MTHSSPGFIEKVVSAFVRSKVTPLIIGFSIFLGALAVFNLPREEEPQISVPMFDIMVAYPGMSAQEVEQRIVNVGERKFWEISGVEYVYSMTRSEGAVFTVRFKVGEDMEKSLIKLYTKVYSNLDLLAKGGSQPLIKLRSIDDVPVLALTFYSSAADPVRLRRVAAEVREEINTVPDVSETQIIGGRKRQFQVRLDESALTRHYLDPLEIGRLIQQANVKVPAGHLEGDRDLVNVESDGFFTSKEDLEGLVVGVTRGQEVFLKDVAQVVDGPDEEETSVDIRFSAPAAAAPQGAVTLSVSKRKGANAARLCAQVLRKVEGLKASLIPGDIDYTVTRDYGASAQDKSNELLFHMALAVLGVTLLMGLALGWRESGVVAVAIPMTLALTLFGFYALGFTLNRITLFALIFSIGILVDDPIVGVENIVRHLRLARNKGRELLDITVEAFREVQSPLILATLTVIAAILPMAFVSGLMGPYMRPIPIGASMAMVFSMMVSFIATPWAAYRILGRAHQQGKLKAHGETEGHDWLTRSYLAYMRPLVYDGRVRRNFVVAVGILLAASVILVPLRLVKVKMLPFDNKDEFQVILSMPEGTSLTQTQAAAAELAEYIRVTPEVRAITVYAGTSAPYNFNGLVRHYFLRHNPWQADIQINLAGKHERKRQSHAIAAGMRPGIQAIARKYAAHVQVAEVPPGPPVLSTLVLEIYGPTLQGQRELAARAENQLTRDPNITDVDNYVGTPQKLDSYKVDKATCALNGIAPSEVAKAMAVALQGEAVDLAHLPGEKEPVEIIVRLPPEKRGSADALLSTTLLSRNGSLISLKDLLVKQPGEKDLTIYHKNLQRVSYVLADVQGKFDSPVYAMLGLDPQLQSLALPEPRPAGQSSADILLTSQPPGSERWSIKWDGEWQVTYEVFRDLGIAFAIVLVLIFTLVVGWFQSFKTPLIIMMPIPLTLIGILPAHWMTNTFFTATSMIGMIAGAGIVVRNSIILVDFIEQRVREGMPLEEAVIDAGAKRFRPMLLTAAAVVVGASVILFDPIFQGLALSLMAGEIASTLLSRTAIPVFYYMAMKKDGHQGVSKSGQVLQIRKEVGMERMVRGIAGVMVLVSLLLAHFFGAGWLWLTAFVGLNLFQSGFTNWCPMMTILRKLGYK